MSELVLDEWKIALSHKRRELEACQAQYQLKSCSKCQKYLECPLRDSYIRAVYDSMSKGVGGGFEF